MNGTIAIVRRSPNHGWKNPSTKPVTIQAGIAKAETAGMCPSNQSAAASAASPTPQWETTRSNPVAGTSGAAIARLARRVDAFVVPGRLVAGRVAAGRVVADGPGVAAGGPPPGRFARLALLIRSCASYLSLVQALPRRLTIGEHTDADSFLRRQDAAGAILVATSRASVGARW